MTFINYYDLEEDPLMAYSVSFNMVIIILFHITNLEAFVIMTIIIHQEFILVVDTIKINFPIDFICQEEISKISFGFMELVDTIITNWYFINVIDFHYSIIPFEVYFVVNSKVFTINFNFITLNLVVNSSY